MSRYGKAIGIWELKVGDADLELKPKMNDNKKLRHIFVSKTFKDMEAKLAAFEEWLYNLIVIAYPPVDDEEIEELKEQINFHAINLFMKAATDFKYLEEKDIKELKSGMNEELKKEIGAA